MARMGLFRALRSHSNHLRSATSATYSSGNNLISSRILANREHNGPIFSSFIHTNALQRGYASKAAVAEEDRRISIGPQRGNNDDDKDAGMIVYNGAISSIIQKVKILSLSTCCLSASLGPVVTFMAAPDMDVIVKGATASIVIMLSASTTAALHWFISPYIHKLRWEPGSDTFEVEMMSWLASPITRTVKFADIRKAETNRPYVTFMANNEFYYVDAEHCHNKALLAKLTPQRVTQPSAFRNL